MNQNGCYIDLHAHLDGSVTVDIAKKLAALQNIALPTDNDEELLALLSVPDSCESLNDFLQCFDLPGRLMQTPEGLQNAVTLVLENMAQDGRRSALYYVVFRKHGRRSRGGGKQHRRHRRVHDQ